MQWAARVNLPHWNSTTVFLGRDSPCHGSRGRNLVSLRVLIRSQPTTPYTRLPTLPTSSFTWSAFIIAHSSCPRTSCSVCVQKKAQNYPLQTGIRHVLWPPTFCTPRLTAPIWTAWAGSQYIVAAALPSHTVYWIAILTPLHSAFSPKTLIER